MQKLFLLVVFAVCVCVCFGAEKNGNESVVKIDKDPKKACLADRCSDRLKYYLLDPTSMNGFDFRRSPCFCDDECKEYGDCCIDKMGKFSEHKMSVGWICGELLPGINNFVYMIGSCPENYPDRETANRCRKEVIATDYSYLLDVPVVSNDSKLFYANLHCARCHGDVRLKTLHFDIVCSDKICHSINFTDTATYLPGRLQWQATYSRYPILIKLNITDYSSKDWSSLSENYKLRKCRPVIKSCLSTYNATELEKKCHSYASYVTGGRHDYMNKHCAKCNELDILDNDLHCTPEVVTRRNFPKFSAPFSVLFDFSSAQGQVGLKECLNGEILDPIHKNCVPFGCGALYEEKDGKCISKEAKRNKEYENETILSFINSDCKTVLISKDETTSLINGTIFINSSGDVYHAGQYEIFNNSWIRICAAGQFLSKFSVVQSRLSNVLITMSLVCLGLHISLRLFFPKLRNLPGKNLLSISVCLFVGQLFFQFGIKKVEVHECCVTIAVIIHFSFLAAFFWMTVMAFDIFRTFSSVSNKSQFSNKSKIYYRYSVFAWVMPMIIVSLALIVDHTQANRDIRPNYGQHICWITNRLGLLIFFIIPVAILLFINVICFVLASYRIHETSHMVECVKRSKECVRFFLYIKLAVIMGLTWIIGFVAALVDIEVLWYAFIFFNASQGAFIFIVFSLKKKVMQDLVEKITGKPFLVFEKIDSTSTYFRFSSTRSSSFKLVKQKS